MQISSRCASPQKVLHQTFFKSWQVCDIDTSQHDRQQRMDPYTIYCTALAMISQSTLWSPLKVLALVDGYSYSELRIQSIKWGQLGSRNLVKLLSHWDGSEIFLSRWSEVRSLSRQSHQSLMIYECNDGLVQLCKTAVTPLLMHLSYCSPECHKVAY